jgi:glycosyltransferase involved in cell wall biosynthesis
MRKKIFVRAPCLSQSGYGEQSRFALRALRSHESRFEIYIQPIPWGHTGWVWENDDFRRWMDKRILETQLLLEKKALNPDISLQITIPNEFQKICPINIGYTAGIETDKVAPIWLQKANDSLDKLLVVSNHAKDTYINTQILAQLPDGKTVPYKLEIPVDVVGETTPRAPAEPIPDFEPTKDFNFLMISQLSERKNFADAITWWVEEFIDQEVGLVVKTNKKNNSLIDCDATWQGLVTLLRKYPDRKCSVHLLHGDMTPGQMNTLYTHPKIKALVNISHGEGFGLPMFEAAREALPVVSVGYSGQLDFLRHDGKDYFQSVDYEMKKIQETAVWKDVLIPESKWAYADQGSYKMTLRKLYKNWQSAKDTALELKEIIENKFETQKLYDNFVNSIHKNEIDEISIDQIPKISLVTSVFKADDYIEQLMEDVTRQSIFEEKCEWVILNANPPGEEFDEQVILKYVEKYPNNIVYKRLEEDPGIYDTWNMGIKMSTGEFVTNVNCDDRRPPWAYEHQAKLLIKNPDVDLVYNDSYLVREPNVMWEDVQPNTEKYNFEQFSQEAMLRSNLPHNNPMWRKSIHNDHGYFNQHYKSAGDWDFWLRCAFGGCKFKKCEGVLGVYYFNPTGMSTNPEHDSWKKEHEKEIFQNYLKIYQEQMAAK